MAAKKSLAAAVADASYGDDAIKALQGLDPVRERPGMYVGELRSVAYTLFREAVENSVDEAQAGHCDTIKVFLTEKNSRLTVIDNGRGIPVGVNKGVKNGDKDQTPMSNLKVIFTILHSGGKFGQGGYTVSGGLHGVGISVANALSSDLEVTTRRDGKMRTLNTIEGHVINAKGEIDENYDPPMVVSDQPKDQTGVTISFTINHGMKTLAGNGKTFPADEIAARMQELSFLVPGLTLEMYVDGKLVHNYHCEDTKQHFDQMLTEGGFELLHEEAIHLRTAGTDSKFTDMTIGFTDSTYKDAIKSYTNTIHNPNKGLHVDGMLDGVYEAFTEAGLHDADNPDVLFDAFEQQDIIRGSFAIVHIGIDDPMYSSQDKKRLVTESAYELCRTHAKGMIEQFIEDRWDEAVNIAKAAQMRCENRKRSSKLKELNGKLTVNTGKGGLQHFQQAGYTECLSTDPNERELFIVEGESAAGNMKRARNKNTQAIQQLKGKIINVERRGLDAAIAHKELSSVMNALQTGVDIACDPTKTRFTKIIVTTDADSDGAHIRAMLITFFVRHMRPLVEAGMLYAVMPPLYGATNRQKWKDYTAFGMTPFELTYQIEEGSRSMKALQEAYTPEEMLAELSRNGWSITRYKGLGEMNEEQSKYTLCDPSTRLLRRIEIGEDAEHESDLIGLLMGDDTSDYRKEMVGGVPQRFGNYVRAVIAE
jgi:DNA gyrase subunit B